MSKAGRYISEHTRNCSNEYLGDSKSDGRGGTISKKKFTPWLTPDQARKAVEIAREEVIEKACNIIRHKYGHYHHLRGDITEELIKEFVEAIKDE